MADANYNGKRDGRVRKEMIFSKPVLCKEGSVHSAFLLCKSLYFAVFLQTEHNNWTLEIAFQPLLTSITVVACERQQPRQSSNGYQSFCLLSSSLTHSGTSHKIKEVRIDTSHDRAVQHLR